MGVGHAGRAARGAAADHHPDRLGAAGKPDIAGFLFEHGTLVRERPESAAAR